MNEGVEIARRRRGRRRSRSITDQVTQRRRGPDGAALPAGRARVASVAASTVAADGGRRGRRGPRDQRGRGSSTRRRGARGPARSSSRDGVLEAVTWLDGRGRRRRRRPTASSSRPGSSTSTPTSASPATRTPRRSRPGSRRRPTAGSRRSALMPNTTPALDEPGGARPGPGRRGGVRVAGRAAGATARSRPDAAGRRWRRSASWPTPASSASPTTGRRSGRRRSCGTRWPTRARSGCRSSTTPRTRR